MISRFTATVQDLSNARRIQEPVQLWVTALFSCGVELLNYGRNEKTLYEQQVVKYRERNVNFSLNKRQSTARFSLTGITYGSRPEHWRIWWAFEYEDFAGDFWRMRDQRSTNDLELVIPDSWVEEPEDCQSVERERLLEWSMEERTPMIWSEYRKIRPPL
ncbi:hypothetical protein K456DRAFT_930278 [Colletotrichum gloeosporioides 23]|nr:hypothetical protein K456DRAFT_930278 [Colletotrichum gloeosporioides 23]